jgi:hypothetical protein
MTNDECNQPQGCVHVNLETGRDAVTRVGDVCITPYAINWDCKQADWGQQVWMVWTVWGVEVRWWVLVSHGLGLKAADWVQQVWMVWTVWGGSVEGCACLTFSDERLFGTKSPHPTS